ncbi:MAG: tyrosine--tRNA ligase [Anaerolineae bacterium]
MPILDEQMAILMQGVEYGDDQIKQVMAAELRQRLEEGRPLHVYCGFDPTAPDLHLGHTVPMNKLRQFQDLGHEVTFLIGSFTGLIGDSSDRDSARVQQTPEQVAQHATSYADQAFRILDRERTHVRRNGEWLADLRLSDVIELASQFTVQQFLAQERLAKRHAAGQPIWMHEMLYALMQGYDAVALQTDVQVGGTEQLFNLMAGRKLQEHYGQRPQVVLTMPILVGTDGHMRMSKTTGNVIGIDEPPNEMYGKVMSLPDHVMLDYYRLVTRFRPGEIAAVEAGLVNGALHPMEAKMQLAREIVSRYHGEDAAEKAEARFHRVFQRGELPPEIPVYRPGRPQANVVDLLVEAELAPSKSQARRLIDQGGVRIDGETVGDIDLTIEVEEGIVVQVGKRKFVRLA